MRIKILVVILLVYICEFLYLFYKLNDIKKDSQKYDVIPGYQEYQRSPYYWRIGRQYRKNDIPERILPSTFILFFVFFVWYSQSIWKINSMSVEGIVKEFVYAEPSLIMIYIILSIVYSLIISCYLALFSSHPRDICFSIFSMSSFNSQPRKRLARNQVWRKWTTYVLIVDLCFCPLRLFLLGSGGRFEETKLVYVTWFGFKETIYNYDEISIDAEIDDETGEYFSFCIINDAGDRVDLCDKRINFIDGADFDPTSFVGAKVFGDEPGINSLS